LSAFNSQQITRRANGQITVGCRSCLTILANCHLPLNAALCAHQAIVIQTNMEIDFEF